MNENFAEFFERFTGRHTIQTFDDRKGNKKLTSIIHFEGKIPSDIATELKYMNDMGAGIYFCVNETDGKGRKATNVVRIRAVYADMDGAPLDKAMEFNPSLVVESSPGRYHCYWYTNDTPLLAFTTLQKSIIRMLNSDPSVHDLPRVLRVAGFYHNKEAPFLSRVHGGGGDIFTYRDLSAWFPPEKKKQFTAKRYQLDKKTSFTGQFRGSYGAGDHRNDHVFKRACGMIGRGCDRSYVSSECYKEGASCSPPLDSNEIEAIIKSAERYRV
jgi:hypothetical protein